LRLEEQRLCAQVLCLQVMCGGASLGVNIRYLGNGGLGFRPDGGSLSKGAKVSKAPLPHHSAPRLGSVFPHSGIAPWARREGPSLAQRVYPGIHAGMPTAQCLRSASVVNGAPKSTSTARRPGSRPGSSGPTPIQLWERACSRRSQLIQHFHCLTHAIASRLAPTLDLRQTQVSRYT
jgi:hypothetical protein